MARDACTGDNNRVVYSRILSFQQDAQTWLSRISIRCYKEVINPPIYEGENKKDYKIA